MTRLSLRLRCGRAPLRVCFLPSGAEAEAANAAATAALDAAQGDPAAPSAPPPVPLLRVHLSKVQLEDACVAILMAIATNGVVHENVRASAVPPSALCLPCNPTARAAR